MKLTPDMESAIESLLGYRKDPIGFGVNVLGMREDYIWDKMVELCEAVRDHRYVAVKAGHSVSKTFTLGRIIVPWFKSCFQPSTVITTAPSDNQVRQQLWREIRAAYAGSLVPLGGDIHTVNWNMVPRKAILETLDPRDRANWEKNFAIGFSTSPDSATEHATKMAGWHNEWVLVVIDEACGILSQIWRTVMEGLMTDEQCRVVAIGNPTDPESEFAKSCYSSDIEKNEGNEPYMSDEDFYVITIAGTDTPNYKEGKRVIPGLASRKYVEGIIKKYGADGDGTRYRVKGLFPTYKEGTFYGRQLALCRKDNRVGDFPHDVTAPVYSFSDYGDVWTATLFVQFLAGKIRIVGDYWDYEGQGAPAWARACDAHTAWTYRGHWAGPDLGGSNRTSFSTGKAVKDTLLSLGYDVTPVIRHSFDDGISAGRELWPLIEIDNSCETLLKGAAGYGKEKNLRLSTDEQTVYHNNVAQTWHRHIMDAWRHLAIVYRYMEIGGQVLGNVEPETVGYRDNYYNPNPLDLARLR